eukprot:753039-Hanusia_phi.AAC.6
MNGQILRGRWKGQNVKEEEGGGREGEGAGMFLSGITDGLNYRRVDPAGERKMLTCDSDVCQSTSTGAFSAPSPPSRRMTSKCDGPVRAGEEQVTRRRKHGE